MKWKMSDSHGTHGSRDNTLPLTPAAYSVNLTPHLSPFYPHCLGQEHLHLWRLAQAQSAQDKDGQPVNITDADLECILDVMSQAWEEGTQETYGSGLLIFHVYCDNKVILELQ
jgi:hypothetical protein